MLQLLTADWQIIADLSFADLVLWLPDRGGDGLLGGRPDAPHDRPDGLRRRRGRQLHARPGAGRCSTGPTPTRRLVREGDPEWRDDVPVRVETIPVPRAGRVIAVIARNTNLLGVRTPSRLELSYLQSAAELTAMIARGRLPGPGPARRPRRLARGSATASSGSTRRAGSTYASPNALSVYRRLGLSGDLDGHVLADLTRVAGAAPAPSRRGDPERGARRPRAPRHRGRRRPGLADRAVDPAPRRGRAHRRARAGARRHRPAAPRPRAGHQGRHDPRDPPPGEEQPADGGRPAAPPGAADRRTGGEAGARGGRTPGRARSRSCTRR